MPLSAKDLREIRAELETRRDKILETAKNQLQSELGLEREELADENDLASSEYLLSFELRLRDLDALAAWCALDRKLHPVRDIASGTTNWS